MVYKKVADVDTADIFIRVRGEWVSVKEFAPKIHVRRNGAWVKGTDLSDKELKSYIIANFMPVVPRTVSLFGLIKGADK